MKILVIGETCRDKFVYGSVSRLCPEAPVPVFVPRDTDENLGMASNVAANVKNIAQHLGIEAHVDILSNCYQGAKTRYIDKASNQMLLRIDNDLYHPINIHQLRSFPIDQYDAVIVSDYNKGYLSDTDLQYIACKSKLSFLDTKKKANVDWIVLFDFIKINEKEYVENDFAYIDEYSLRNMIVTLADKGCRFQNKRYALEQSIQVRDVTGAGDTFLAAFATHYLVNQNTEQAIHFAQKCCTNVVQKKGVATPF